MVQHYRRIIRSGPGLKQLTLNLICFIILSITFVVLYLQFCTNWQAAIPVIKLEPESKSILVVNSESKNQSVKSEPVSKPKKLVIVVQVHKREMYLKYLIDSLRGAAEIESAYLIFSHDYYDENINKLIATIEFCKYKQIYYPYSIQNFTNEFPGQDTVTGDENDRNATTAQIKHHWWWKASTVFNSLSAKNYTGLVLFLEEDYYAIEDFIPTLRQMEIAATEFCKNCKILSLSANPDGMNVNRAKVENVNFFRVTTRFSNMGMALNLATWKEIANCKDSFCKYNDVNWDFSLQNVFATCLKDLESMELMFPRIIHIGSCGIHVKSKNCDPSDTISQIKKKLVEVDGKLFPKKLVQKDRTYQSRLSRPNGGWKDSRDHKLCINLASSINEDL